MVKRIAGVSKGDKPMSAFKGRILLSLLSEHVDDPQLGLSPIAPCEEPPVANYVLRFNLYMGTEIQTKTLDKIQVFVRIGDVEITSKKMELQKNGRVEFF